MLQFTLKQLLFAVACFAVGLAIIITVPPIAFSVLVILIVGLPGLGVGALFRHPVIGFCISVYVTPPLAFAIVALWYIYVS